MRSWLRVFGSVIMAGCTGGRGSEDHRTQLDALVGASRAALVQRFGQPARESVAEEQSFLTWDDLQLSGGRAGRRVQVGLVDAVAPGRGYRALARQVELTPTAFNKRDLAEERLRLGRAEEAVGLYRECLTGLHAEDPALRYGLARSLFEAGDAKGAVAALDALSREHPEHRTAEGHLLYARALDAAGWVELAQAEYAAVVAYFAGEEARCRYAESLARAGRGDEAAALYREVVQRVELVRGNYRRDQRAWYDQARRGLAGQVP